MFQEEGEASAWLERHFWNQSTPETVRCWLPRRCHETHKSLWFKKAVKRTQMIDGPGTPVVIVRWYCPLVHTLLSLQK